MYCLWDVDAEGGFGRRWLDTHSSKRVLLVTVRFLSRVERVGILTKTTIFPIPFELIGI